MRNALFALWLCLFVACQKTPPSYLDLPTSTPRLSRQVIQTEATPTLPTIASADAPPSADWSQARPTIALPALATQFAPIMMKPVESKVGLYLPNGALTEAVRRWIQQHDQAGIPLTLVSADDPAPLLLAQGGHPDNTLVYRLSDAPLPDYTQAPALQAELNWAWHEQHWPPTLDPAQVWRETMNEFDPTQSAWVAEFATTQAKIAREEGKRVVLLSWAVAQPSKEQWLIPAMRELYQLLAQHPDQLAIGLHEFAEAEHLFSTYPSHFGRFMGVFEIADSAKLARPTIILTQWGWKRDGSLTPVAMLDQLVWANSFMAQFPPLRGAALWLPSAELQANLPQLLNYNLTSYQLIPNDTIAAIDPNAYAP